MKTLMKYRKPLFVLLLVVFATLFILPATRKVVFGQACTGTPNPNCAGGCCYATTGVWKLPNTSAQACSWRPAYCVENWNTNFIVRCPGPRGTSCRTNSWDQGRCKWNAAGYCTRVSLIAQTTCCNGSGGGGSPTPTPCTPTFDPPSISLGGYSPPYPLVLGQDPDLLGIDVTIAIQGGSVNNGCRSGRASLTGLSLDGVALSPASISWIQTYLNRRYPGAQVLGSYPLHPPVTTSSLPSPSATLWFHFDPLDPGTYEVTVTATQTDNLTATAKLAVPAHLLDATLDQ